MRLLADHRVRFLLVGGVNTAVGYATFAVLEWLAFGDLRFGYFLSLVGSYVVGISVAFLLYRRFVFSDTGFWLWSLLRFIGVYAFTIALNAALLPVLVEWFSISPLIAQMICIVVNVIISYLGHRFVSFRTAAQEEQAP